jgi:hypothetical protein
MKSLIELTISRSTYSTLFLLIIFSFTFLQSIAQTRNGSTSASTLHEVQQRYNLDPNSSFLSRVSTTPDDILKMFRDAGMSPTDHSLTHEEIKIIATAFSRLPPLHQQVLKQHLKSISFLDNMPNTALTSPVTKEDGINLYHITFRSGILHQTISEWVTEKERTCFAGGDSSISVSVQAGMLSALTYVMLHEGTHVLDGSLRLVAIDTIAGFLRPNSFTQNFSQGIWKDITTHAWTFADSIVVKSRFRQGGRQFLSTEATRVYSELSKTPFVSLYSTSSWHEDLAELLTVYHLTTLLKQPFTITITQNGTGIFRYEPMRSGFIKKRTRLLNRFYAKSARA